MEYNPFVHIEIYVDNLDRAVRFYETVLNIEMSYLTSPDSVADEQMVFFPGSEKAFGCGGSLVKSTKQKPGCNSVVPYFGSEDCSVELGKVEAAGGKVVQSKFSIEPHGFCGIAIDTEGNTIGFHSMQ